MRCLVIRPLGFYLSCIVYLSGCGALLDSLDEVHQDRHQRPHQAATEAHDQAQNSLDISTIHTTDISKTTEISDADQSGLIRDHTQLLQESGDAKVGARMPFFSGWLTTGRVLNLSGLLKKKRSRYVITMCASWCKPCFDGLRLLSKAKDEFQRQDIELVIYVVDTELEAKKIHKRFGFDWAQVLSDQFKTHARTFSSGKNGTVKQTVELPKTFVLDREGKIEIIIGQEGEDFINLLLSKGD
jgi:peroxiredoxin